MVCVVQWYHIFDLLLNLFAYTLDRPFNREDTDKCILTSTKEYNVIESHHCLLQIIRQKPVNCQAI